MPVNKGSQKNERPDVVSGLLIVSPLREIGAGDGIRTHDPNLGKVMLYP
jgi:hypothetical protein